MSRTVASLLVSTLLVLGLFAPLPPAAAGEAEIIVTEQDQGRQVQLRQGQILSILLQDNPSTGYLWEVPSLDDTVLRTVGEPEFRTASALLGAPGTVTWQFEAIAPGATELVLVYRRPWEEGPPARTFAVQVQGVGLFVPGDHSPAPAPASVSQSGNEGLVPADGPLAQALPSAFSWCSLGGCPPVRNQGQCGSCWAFATVGPLEARILISQGLTRDLAEQYLVSCNQDGYSCDGGWWAHDYHGWRVPPGEPAAGAVYEAEFPYQADDLACNPPHPHHEKIVDWRFVGPASGIPAVADIKQAIYDNGPVAATVCVNDAFRRYTSGVFAGPGCTQINHGIVLVGWDDARGAAGAWRLRNSWGAGWGESGYMWIPYGMSQVGYSANYVVYVGSKPNAPSSLQAILALADHIHLRWSDNSGDESGFKIERSPDGTSGWAQIVTVGANVTAHTDRGLSPNTAYFYRVRATNALGDSSYSNVTKATTIEGFAVFLPLAHK